MFGRKTVRSKSYDRENFRPALKCSICTGEQTAGFLEVRTGQFEDIMLIRGQKDLDEFIAAYHLDPAEITKIY